MNTIISLLFIRSRNFLVWLMQNGGALVSDQHSLLTTVNLFNQCCFSASTWARPLEGLQSVLISEQEDCFQVQRNRVHIILGDCSGGSIHPSIHQSYMYMYKYTVCLIYNWYKCTSSGGLIQQFFHCREPQQKKKKKSLLGCPELFIPAQHMKRLLTPQCSNRAMRGSSVRRRGLRAPIESGNDCEGKYSLFHCWPTTHSRGTVWKHTAKKIG